MDNNEVVEVVETEEILDDLVKFESNLEKLANEEDPTNKALIVQDLRESYSTLYTTSKEAVLNEAEIKEKYFRTLEALNVLSSKLAVATKEEATIQDIKEEVEEEEEITLEDTSAAFEI